MPKNNWLYLQISKKSGDLMGALQTAKSYQITELCIHNSKLTPNMLALLLTSLKKLKLFAFFGTLDGMCFAQCYDVLSFPNITTVSVPNDLLSLFPNATHVDVNSQVVAGRSLLTMTRTIEIAQYLISQGININAQDKYRESALMIALKQSEFCDKRKEFIQLLLDNGVDVNLKNYRSIAPIDIAPELIHSLKK